MKICIIYVRKNNKQSLIHRKVEQLNSFAMPIVIASLGIADALEPFKMIIAEASDPICFVGGSMGLYRIGMGDREGGFKQVLNATFAQVGFFLWPKLQIAIRSGLGS